MKTYNLNQGQKAAADAFMSFLFSPDKEFIISGAAGVGKTHLMTYLIDETMPRYHETCQVVGMEPEYVGVVMTATTNKAAEVLAHVTQRPTRTVHSFFGLRVQDDFSTGKTSIQKTRNWRVHERIIIFIDECSMVDTELWKAIQEGTMKCKIVYVGDHNQLAPVHEKISPVYIHSAPIYELTEPMRNAAQPALMEVCQQLRETVSTNQFRPIKLVPGVIDLLDPSQMQVELYHKFSQQTLDSRILAYTNKRVIEFNDYIRSIRNLPNEFQPGENLVNNSVFQHGDRNLPVESAVKILKNYGPNKFRISDFDSTEEVFLDVNYVDLETDLGDIWRNIPIPLDRDHYMALIKYCSKAKNWPKYFHLKNEFLDLRPRDAATVHKSQGSTYDSVFIDLGNISTCHIQHQVARMLYVAFSRARERIFLYGKLADKYGGLIS